MSNAKWVENNYKLTLTDFQKKAVELMCRSQKCGAYDLGCWKKADWGTKRVSFTIYSFGLSTYDFDELTKLVIGAHEMMIRVSISASKKNHIVITFQERTAREGETWLKHPTIEQAIESYRSKFKGGE